MRYLACLLLLAAAAWADEPATSVPELLAQAREAKSKGDVKTATERLQRVIAAAPETAEAHWLLGWLLAGQRLRDEATREFQAFLKLTADGPLAEQARAALDRLAKPALDPDGVSHDLVTVPLIFPVVGKVSWSDTFLAARGGGTRRHLGQDLPAEKMRPLVACFDGVIRFHRGVAPTLTVVGDHGWSATYIHINNDTPGTNDNVGGEDYSVPLWLQPGDRVVAGQLVAWCGNSGNAEQTIPHLHFELWNQSTRGVYNAYASLRAARHVAAPVYPRPLPALKPLAGERRLDGAVREWDAARGVLVIDQVAATDEHGAVTVSGGPSRGTLKVSPASELHLWRDPAQRLTPAELQPGMGLVALGRADGEGTQLRLAYVEPSRARPVPQPKPVTGPPVTPAP